MDSSASALPTESIRRLWQAFLSARFLVATLLVALQITEVWHSKASNSSDQWPWLITAVYWAISLLAWLALYRNPPLQTWRWPWIWLLVADVVCMCALQAFQAGTIHYTPLLALPVLTASVLGTMRMALAVTSAITLLLLSSDVYLQWSSASLPETNYTQTALLCAGFFAVAYLTHQLAQRLADQAQQTHAHRLAAQSQAQVNSLVVANLSEGVLVVDQHYRVHMANSTAQELLGLTALTNTQDLLSYDLRALHELIDKTFGGGQPLSEAIELATDAKTTIKLHARTWLTSDFPTSPSQTSETFADPQDTDASHAWLCVVFLQDLRELEARMRTEKMASMGRMSAAVAHEIRNPLAAILQANALLAEELSQPLQQQLSRMIEKNAQRLAHIAEDILNIARVQQHAPSTALHAIALDNELAHIVQEWRQAHPLPPLAGLTLGSPNACIAFDSEHLRRIVTNLLDNALHYGQLSHADSIQVHTGCTNDSAWLAVWSAGSALEASVEKHLFEPFFSSQSRSSGLGLFICRELCMRHGATIGYERSERLTSHGVQSGNTFKVHFKSSLQTPDHSSLF